MSRATDFPFSLAVSSFLKIIFFNVKQKQIDLMIQKQWSLKMRWSPPIPSGPYCEGGSWWVLTDVFLTSAPHCALGEPEDLLCVLFLAKSTRAPEWLGFTLETLSTFWSAGNVLERAGGLSNLGVTEVLPVSSLRSSSIHWKILGLHLPVTSGFWSLLCTLVQFTSHRLALVTAVDSPSIPFPFLLHSAARASPGLPSAQRLKWLPDHLEGKIKVFTTWDALLKLMVPISPTSSPIQPQHLLVPPSLPPTTVTFLLFLGHTKQFPTSGPLYMLFLLLRTHFPLMSAGLLSSLFRWMPPTQRSQPL